MEGQQENAGETQVPAQEATVGLPAGAVVIETPRWGFGRKKESAPQKPLVRNKKEAAASFFGLAVVMFIVAAALAYTAYIGYVAGDQVILVGMGLSAFAFVGCGLLLLTLSSREKVFVELFSASEKALAVGEAAIEKHNELATRWNALVEEHEAQRLALETAIDEIAGFEDREKAREKASAKKPVVRSVKKKAGRPKKPGAVA